MTSKHEDLEPEEPPQGKARGGAARAASLTPEERTAIAKRAADARWADQASAICGSPEQPLRIGEIEIECYVLGDRDQTRVLTQASFLEALGRHRKANVRREGGEDQLPAVLQGRAINPYISDEVRELSRPITFRTPSGARANGYKAELLPAVCEIYLKAQDNDALPTNQKHVARQAEILVRGLARVGIIALVDEATGYQEVRAKNALARILEAYVDPALQPYIKTFPDDYYRELFRIRGLEYPQSIVKKPRYFGHLTSDIVYKRMAPGIWEELKRVTPRSESGAHKDKLFRRLTSNIGYPHLREHLGSVVTLMKLSKDYPDFLDKLDRIHPRIGDTLLIPFDDGFGL